METDGNVKKSTSRNNITLNDLWHLADKGSLQHADWRNLVGLVRDGQQWRAWIYRTILVLGAAHLLAGVLFFFAYNWDDLSKVAKFSILFGLVGCSFATWWLAGPDSRLGELSGVGATFLTGVLLTVFGQIYQTGADAHDLFLAWAVLTIPWALVSKSPIHLLIWVVIADTAYGLFANQVMRPLWDINGSNLLLINAAILVCVLAITAQFSRKYDGLLTWWLAGTLIIGIALHLGAAGWWSAVDVASDSNIADSNITELLVSLVLQAALFAFFFRIQPNILGCTLALATVISTVTLYLLVDLSTAILGAAGLDLFVMSILVVAASALFVHLARITTRNIRGRQAV